MAILIKHAVGTSRYASSSASTKLHAKLYASLLLGAFVISAGVAA